MGHLGVIVGHVFALLGLLSRYGLTADSKKLEYGVPWKRLKQGRFRADIQTRPYVSVDSKKLTSGPATIYAGLSFISRLWGGRAVIFQLSSFYCK